MTTCPHVYSTHALGHQKHDIAQADRIRCTVLVMNQTCEGVQTPFSFISDPDQNKEDASIIIVVVYVVYIPL